MCYDIYSRPIPPVRALKVALFVTFLGISAMLYRLHSGPATYSPRVFGDPRPIPPVFLGTRDLFPFYLATHSPCFHEQSATHSPRYLDHTQFTFPFIPRPIPPVFLGTRDLFPPLFGARSLVSPPSPPSHAECCLLGLVRFRL